MIEQAVEEVMLETWDLAADGIDYEHLTANLNSAIRGNFGQSKNMRKLKSLATTHAGKSTHGEAAKQTGISLSHLLKRAEDTLKYIKSFMAAGKTEGRNEKSLSKLQKEIENAQEQFINFLKEIGGNTEKGIISFTDTQKYNAALSFSELIRKGAQTLMIHQAKALCEGDLAEYVTAAVEAVAFNTVDNVTKDLLKDIIRKNTASARSRGSSLIRNQDIDIHLQTKMESEIMKDTVYQFKEGKGENDTVGWYGRTTQ